MTRAKRNTGWMQRLAQDKRDKVLMELDHWCETWYLLACEYPNELETTFYVMHERMAEALFIEENFWYVQKLIIHRIFGDPSVAQSTGYKIHMKPYWNPTPHKLGIAAMGLEEDCVGPGEQIMIPTIYTTGGKYATYRGVAPQLRALPIQIDNSLDLAPISFAEWCTFQEPEYSDCCDRPIYWHMNRHRLLCGKCGKE